jgi:uncharacterized membrane protein YccF (DUF307 family)
MRILGNMVWFLISGLWLVLAHLLAGLLLCLTISGIPLDLASFKMAGLAVAPLGKEIVPRAAVDHPGQAVVAAPAPFGR